MNAVNNVLIYLLHNPELVLIEGFYDTEHIKIN